MPSITRNPLDCGFLAEAIGVLSGAAYLLHDCGGRGLLAKAITVTVPIVPALFGLECTGHEHQDFSDNTLGVPAPYLGIAS